MLEFLSIHFYIHFNPQELPSPTLIPVLIDY